MIYFIQAPSDGAVKIGWSRDVKGRLQNLQGGNPHRLAIIRLLDARPWVEKWLHQRFESLRLVGEWFNYHPDMLSIIPPDQKPNDVADGLFCGTTGIANTTVKLRISQFDKQMLSDAAETIGVSLSEFMIYVGRWGVGDGKHVPPHAPSRQTLLAFPDGI